MSPRIERAAKIITAAATLWFAFAVTWGLFARIGGGHDAQIATRAIVAENMRAWHEFAPVKDYTLVQPSSATFYVHHPWGMFWLITMFSDAFGRGTWVPTLVGVLMSVATPPLLYGIGRTLWGPVGGALSALAYVVLPITLAFGHLPGFEVPVIFFCLLATWGYLRFTARWRRQWMVVSLIGIVGAANSDWQGYVFIGTVLVSLAMGNLMLPRWFGWVPVRPFTAWWILAALLSAGSLAGYIVYFQHIGLLENLIHVETERARGTVETPLRAVLHNRSYWIDVTFTPLVVTIGKIAAPLFVLRVLFWRRIHEMFPLAILLMATMEYVKLKNGADVHIYWPMPFAPYWALSLGMLGTAFIGATQWVLRRLRREDRRGLVPVAALAIFGWIALRVLPDGIIGLHYAKATAGRFNENGKRIFNDVDMSEAMQWLSRRMDTHNTIVAMASDLFAREYRGQEWAIRRPLIGVVPSQYFAAPHGERYFVGDLRFLNGDDQRHAATTFHMVTLGPYYLIDRDAPLAPLDAYAFDEREPNLLEWYFTSPTEPVRTVRPDPWGTWELREHYDQTPNPPPAAPPKSLEEIRIAHNVALAAGDVAKAEKWKGQLLSALDTTVGASFNNGAHLIGKRFVRGVDPKLELYFLVEGPLANDHYFEVVSKMISAPPLSLVPLDHDVKKYGDPFVISPRLWRKGFIYVELVDIRHRPGREHFSGYFEAASITGGGGRPGGGLGVQLMMLE